MLRREMFSPTKPQTVSVFFAGVIRFGGRRWACGEMSFHLFCLVVLLIQSVFPNDQRKSVYRPSWLSVIRDSVYQYNFRNENSVAVLIYPVKNHLTVGTRARLTSLGNIGFGIQIKPRRKTCTVLPRTSSSSLTNHPFSLWKWYFGLYTPSKKSSRFRNACRASDWWHHLISSSRFRYPNNLQKKNSKAPTRHDNIRMTSEKVINCYHESQQLVGRTRFYHLAFVMKMMCDLKCSSRGAFGV